MQVLDILSLPLEKDSIKKIDRYMISINETTIEYYQALAYKALILNSLSKTNEALKLILPALDKLLKLEKTSLTKDKIVCLADTLKVIFLSLKRYDLALKYIELKEENLSLMAHEAYYKDMIIYTDSLKKYDEMKRFAKMYLADDISHDNYIFVHEKLLYALYLEGNYLEFMTSYDILKEEYQKNKDRENLLKINIYKAHLLASGNNAFEAINLIKEIIEDIKDASVKLDLATLLIKMYYEQGDFHKAAIQDANFIDLVSLASIDVQKKYYEVVRDLYEKMNNAYSRDLATKALEELAKKEEEPKSPVKERHRRIQEPIVIEKIVDSKEVLTAEKKAKENTFFEVKEEIELSKEYAQLAPVFATLNEFSILKDREVLRQAFIKAKEVIDFDEVIIYLTNGNTYYYKKERLYDKFFDSLVEKSIIFYVMSQNKPFITSHLEEYDFISLITNEKETFKSAISFLLKTDEVYGAILFLSDSDLLKTGSFELVSFLTSAINLRLSIDEFERAIIKKDEEKSYLLSSMPFGLKKMVNNSVTFSDKAKFILSLEEDKLSYNDYLDLLSNIDKVAYNNIIRNMINTNLKSDVIEYTLLSGKRIKEYLYLKELSSSFTILSILEDKTEEYSEYLKLKKKSEEDVMTNLPSLNEFKERLKILEIDKKYSFILIGAKNFKLYKDVYGLKFSNDLIIAISLKLKSSIKNDMYLYHYDSDKFILIVPKNDERTVKKLVLSILDDVTFKLEVLNKRVKLYFGAGIYLVQKRQPKQTFSSLLEKASLALDEALKNQLHENSAIYYETDAVKKSFYNFQMELYISEAIDNLKIGVCYEPILKITSKKLFAYEATLNLENTLVDEAYFLNIVKTRQLEELVDKYLIVKTFTDCKKFYERFGAYFRIFLKIHHKTLANPDFLAFLYEQYHEYKIPKNIFSIEIIDDANYNIKEILDILAKDDILVGSSNLELVLNANLGVYFAKSDELPKLNAIKGLAEKLKIDLVLSGNNIDIKLLEESGFMYLRIIGKKVLLEDIINGISENK